MSVPPARETVTAHGERRWLELQSPADGGSLGRVPVRTPPEVREAVERGRRIQGEWWSLPPGDRVRRLRALLPVLAARASEIADSVAAETGKPEVEALAEVAVIMELVRHYVKTAEGVLRPRRVGTGLLVGKTARVYREPYGVVGIISPWNYPFILVMDPVLSSVFAGNAAVVKPSEFTPLTALLAEDLWKDARLPEGLVQVMTGDGSTGAALVNSGVDRISFTGSSAVGRKIMASAAEQLVPVTLELGGKDPAIVLEDADLDRAAAGVLFGAFFNAGQTCISVERVYVVDAVFDAFAERVTKLAQRLRAGAAGEFDVGPLTTPAQLDRVERHLQDALARGARVVVGGARADPASNVILPTVLVDVAEDMELMKEETFGPILPLIRVDDVEEAVTRANEGPYGLFASVWTRNVEKGEAVGRRLRAGGVSVNDVLSHFAVPGLPMGGLGASGFGRTRGAEGLMEMSRTRSVLVHRWGFKRELFWFPYGKRTAELLRGIVAWRGGQGFGRLVRALLGRRR